MKMCDHALNLAYQGFAVFPLHHIARWDVEPQYRCTCRDAKTEEGCEAPGKHPLWDRGTLERGLYDATKEFLQIEKWWAKWPKANIGIATGQISGVFVIDVDGEDGKRSVKALERRCGKLPKTLTAQTGKGYHLFYRSGGREYRNRTAFVPGIDIRGDGGYVVAPPSVHVLGKRYRFDGDGVAVDPPPYIRQLLIDAPKPKGLWRPGKPRDYGDQPKPHMAPSSVGEIPNGERHDRLVSLAARWRWEGKTPGEIRDLLIETNKTKCKPPAPMSMLKKIWEYSGKWRVEG